MLRTLGRRIANRTKVQTQEKNRLHAAKYTRCKPVAHDIELEIRHARRRITALQSAALDLVWKTPRLRKQLAHLRLLASSIVDIVAIF